MYRLVINPHSAFAYRAFEGRTAAQVAFAVAEYVSCDFVYRKRLARTLLANRFSARPLKGSTVFVWECI